MEVNMITKIDFPTSLPPQTVGKKNNEQKLAFEAATPEGKTETQVNISSAGANKLQQEQASSASAQVKLLDVARNNPEEAAKLAFDLANSVDQPLLDISGGLNKIKFSQTGVLLTPENKASFQQQANEVSAKKLALFQEEKGKGTPDALIFEKLLSLVNNQSEEYKNAIGFGLRQSGLF
jgi:uncharacterized protein HemY